MNDAQINQVIRFFGYKVHKVFDKQKGYRNESYHIVISTLDSIFPQTDANLILYKNDADILKRINAANLVSNYLSSKGFPTRSTIAGNKICSIKLKDGKKRYVCLYNYLPGNTIPWEGYTMKHIKLLGKTMALIHKELQVTSYMLQVKSSKKMSLRGGTTKQTRTVQTPMTNGNSKLAIRNPKFQTNPKYQIPNSKEEPISHIPYHTSHITDLKTDNQQLSHISYPTSHIPNVITELKELQVRMTNYFADDTVQKAMKEKLNVKFNVGTLKRYNEIFNKLNGSEDMNILHMDFVRSNILFQENPKFQIPNSKQKNKAQSSKEMSLLAQRSKPDQVNPKSETRNPKQSHISYLTSHILVPENKNQKPKTTSEQLTTINYQLAVSGILDFEKTAYGPTIIDIARTLAFLIVDCKYKSEKKVRKYFLKSGYEKRGGAQLENIEFLDELLKFFWLHDFYKFLRHNPYEYLKENEHYVRTIDFLLKREYLSTN